MTYDALLAALRDPRRTHCRDGIARAHRAYCPACQGAGQHSSHALSVAETGAGVVLLHCMKGCTPDEITGALGIEIADLFPTRTGGTSGGAAPAPEAWVSAAAWAEAVDAAGFDLLARVVSDPVPAYQALHRAIEGFNAAAQDAMRSAAKGTRS
ncbi:MAG: hypothetical protein EPN34_14715 [Burkholderiaceae bacterium]|nr:MAG: hypothetical protein EPN34_14715 [Burkholderiaceae bacterium]